MCVCNVTNESVSPIGVAVAVFGDPSESGVGGETVSTLIARAQSSEANSHSHSQSPPADAEVEYLEDEGLNLNAKGSASVSRHSSTGTVGLWNLGRPNTNSSMIYVTLKPNLSMLDATHTVIGQVVEGLDVLSKLAAVPRIQGTDKPAAHIRIKHTYILDDPFPPHPLLHLIQPPQSPLPITTSHDYDVLLSSKQEQAPAKQKEEEIKEEAKSKATVLEIVRSSAHYYSCNWSWAENEIHFCPRE